MLQKFLFVFSILVSLAFSSFLVFENKLHAALLVEGRNIGGEQILGGNYHSQKNYFDTGISCLSFSNENRTVIYNEKASVTATSMMDYDSLSRELSNEFSIGSSLPYGDPIGLGFSFLRNVKETKTSLVFVYKTLLKTGSVVLKGPHKLSKEAKESADFSGVEFSRYCGDQYVYKLEKGAKAFVAVKVELGSEKLKRAIGQEFGIALVDFFDISNQLKKMISKYGIKGKVTVSGYQEGGFAARINSIFGNGEGIGQCSGSSFAKCEILLKEVVHYFSHDFSEQFDQYYRDRNVLGGGRVVELPPSSKTLRYKTQSYCKLAIRDRPKNLSCQTVLIDGLLEKLLNKEKMYRKEFERIEEHKDGSVKLAKDIVEKLKVYSQELVGNLSLIKETRSDCYKDSWSCQYSWNQVKKLLRPIDEVLMNSLKSEKRIEICLETGFKNQIKNFRMSLGGGGRRLKVFKSLGQPIRERNECFLYHAPEFSSVDFDEFFLQVQNLKQEGVKCRRRLSRKFSIWSDWDIKRVTVTRLKDGVSKEFEGHHFFQKSKCRREDDSNPFGPWVKLKLKGQ